MDKLDHFCTCVAFALSAFLANHLAALSAHALPRDPSKEKSSEVKLEDGLKAWFAFDGNAVDHSGNGNHGKIEGAVSAFDRHERRNTALYFDGGSRVVVAGSPTLNPSKQLTIGMWLKFDEFTNQWSPVIHKGGTYRNGFENREYSLWLNNNSSLHFASAGRKSSQKTYDASVPKNQWFHYTVVLDRKKGECIIYLNAKVSLAKEDPFSDFSNNQDDLVFGSSREENLRYSNFKGFIDEVRIYDRALSEEEVQALYELESYNSSDRATPPPPPNNDPGAPPDPDYKDTIAELKRLLAEKDEQLAHCEKETAAKNKEIGELTSEKARLQGEAKSLNGKINGLEKEVASLQSDNQGLQEQVRNLRQDNQNLGHDLATTTENLEETVRMAETPFINGWVYDPQRGWIFTDAEHFPLVYTYDDQSWNYYELGSSNPRYFYNYTTQEWVAWDVVPSENQQVAAVAR